MQHKLSPIKIGALLTYISIVFNIVVGLLYTPWMINKIGQCDYGLYTLATSIISLFLLDFGLGSATSRFVAKYRASNDENGLQHFLSTVYKLYLIIDVIIFLILFIIFSFLDSIYSNFTPQEIEKLRVLFGIVGLYSLISFPCISFNGILTAYEKFIPLKTADLIQRIGSVLLIVVALISGKGLYSLVIANAVFGLISISIKAYIVRKNVRIRFIRSPLSLYKELLGFSFWSTVWAMSQRLIFNITPTIIGITMKCASSAIAIFGIITTIEGYFYTITTAINGMFISRITKVLMGNESRKELTALMIKVGRFQFLLNGMIVVGFFLIGKEFIHLWMGESFESAYIGILFVVIPGLFYNSLQIANTTIVVQNLIKYQAIIQIIIGCCNVCLAFSFSWKWGVMGACMSICFAYTLRLVLNLILIKKRINVDLKAFIKSCYLRMSVSVVISIIVGFLVLSQVQAFGWGAWILKGIFVVAIYLIFTLLLGVNHNERHMILKRIKKIKTRITKSEEYDNVI